jgi:gentisate 1,2-dioxygenase
MQIALPFEFMGTQSNGNPYCGKSLTLLNPTTGQTVQATVGDKCMGCTGRSIDCTDALFSAIVPGGDGRVSGIEWWFN